MQELQLVDLVCNILGLALSLASKVLALSLCLISLVPGLVGKVANLVASLLSLLLSGVHHVLGFVSCARENRLQTPFG